jgi:hypothetical protein
VNGESRTVATAPKEESMSSTTTARPTFSNEQLAELIELIKGSDSVELKLTVPESHQRSAIRALELDPLDAEVRQVFFFDTPDLALETKGVVVRARRIQGKGGDTVVKLRPVVPAELPAELRKSGSFKVEVDALPGGFVCSGSLKGTADLEEVLKVAAGERPVKKLFSKEQREFYAAHAPEGIALSDLSVLGPIFVLKLRFTPVELNRRLVAEMWFYPDGSRVLELSTRCTVNDTFQVAAETSAFLAGRGIDLTGEQATKTRKALEFYTGTLREAAE